MKVEPDIRRSILWHSILLCKANRQNSFNILHGSVSRSDSLNLVLNIEYIYRKLHICHCGFNSYKMLIENWSYELLENFSKTHKLFDFLCALYSWMIRWPIRTNKRHWSAAVGPAGSTLNLYISCLLFDLTFQRAELLRRCGLYYSAHIAEGRLILFITIPWSHVERIEKIIYGQDSFTADAYILFH